MTDIVLVTDDKLIVKDGLAETINDDLFWSNYSTIHAVQIHTDGTSWIENKDGSQSTPNQEMIDEITNKYNFVKSEREEKERIEEENFQNSWLRVRQLRGEQFTLTDKYMISDYPITAEKRTEFETYRTALRDLPETYSSEEPRNITFDENGNVSVNGTQVITKPGA